MSESVIHDALIKIEKRAEHAADQKLADTFVDAAPLLASVSTNDNQILFGRRGTGKTHILKYLHDTAKRDADIAIYLDLRAIGSNGSIYGDLNRTPAQRATPLLLDVLQAVHEALLNAAVDLAEVVDLSITGPRLDALADAISSVRVVGTAEVTTETSATGRSADKVDTKLGITSTGVEANIGGSVESSLEHSTKGSAKFSGEPLYYVNFGNIQSELRAIVNAFKGKRIWLLLDEWSEVPLDLQPYLADLIRRAIIPIQGITIKIAAIEHRCNFSIRRIGEYTGIELGADAGGDVNLDDFMVFDNDSGRAKHFFSALLFKHFRATEGLDPSLGPQSPEGLVHDLFTQITAFEEFVRAVEGVPRDAVYLASMVARRAYGRHVSVQDVRAASRDWYQRDKSTLLRSEPELSDLLNWIIQEVIAHRRARAFLFPAIQRHPLIDTLFDARLVHILKKNVSSNDEPGKRFDVYKLDYGCYVDLITGTRAPIGLLPSDSGDGETGYVDVPPDDYRSIRRAILDVAAFDKGRRNTIEANADA